MTNSCDNKFDNVLTFSTRYVFDLLKSSDSLTLSISENRSLSVSSRLIFIGGLRIGLKPYPCIAGAECFVPAQTSFPILFQNYFDSYQINDRDYGVLGFWGF